VEHHSSAHAGCESNCTCSASSGAGAPGSVPPWRSRTRALAALAVAAAAAVAWAVPSGSGDLERTDPAALPAYAHIERDGLRYEFEALTSRERLSEIAPDGSRGRDVLAERRDAAARLRAALEAELGVDSLERLVEAHSDAAESLRALGYL
jgi:hypothetical protein